MSPRPLALTLWFAAWGLFALPGPAPLTAQEPEAGRYYLSNELGMALEEIGWYRRDEAEFVLVLREQPDGEVRTLLRGGEEVRRWEREGREERIYEQGELSEKTLLEAQGRRAELWEYEGGVLVRRTEYTYSPAGRISARAYDGEGRLLFTDTALLSRDRALREVRRDPGQRDPSRLALSMAGDRLVEERIGGAGQTMIRRYDLQGRVFERERWLGARLAERETLFYSGNDETPVRSTLVDYVSGSTTERSYDGNGNLQEIAVERDGRVVEQTRYERDSEGRAVLAVRRGPLGLEQWRYEYDEEGQLAREEHRLRGSVQRVTAYQGGERSFEELYRDGAPFMRIVYRDGEKVREEFLKDGAVVRTRELR
ncbi:MAG: hypothetical protein JW820_10175 [Spirochaetales bacterium]|nr:hypothetical protein [Spirochaetales bacterium]